MCKFVAWPRSLFDEYGYNIIEIRDELWQLLLDDLVIQVLFNGGRVIQLIDIIANVCLNGIAEVSTLNNFHKHFIAMDLSAFSNVYYVFSLH